MVTVPISVLKRRRNRTAPELRGVIVVWGVEIPHVAAVSLLVKGGTTQRGLRCLWGWHCSPCHLCDLFLKLSFFLMWVRDPLYMFSIAICSKLAVAKSTVKVAHPLFFLSELVTFPLVVLVPFSPGFFLPGVFFIS